MIKFVAEVRFLNGEALEVYRTPGGGLFGVDSSFLDQVGTTVYEPFDGTLVKIKDFADVEVVVDAEAKVLIRKEENGQVAESLLDEGLPEEYDG